MTEFSARVPPLVPVTNMKSDLGDIWGISWANIGDILAMSWDIMRIYKGYLGHILGISWRYLGDIWRISGEYLGHKLEIALG